MEAVISFEDGGHKAIRKVGGQLTAKQNINLHRRNKNRFLN
jgi:hypothetical protein